MSDGSPNSAGSRLAIKRIEDGLRWDAFAGAQPDCTFCHLHGWHDILRDVLGHECCYYVAEDARGHWHGALPLARVKSRLFGHYLVSMPFLNYGGPLGTAAAQTELTEAAVEEARRSGADLLELRTRHGVSCEMSVSHRKLAVLLELPSTAAELWEQGFPAKLRSQIRRSQKDGMAARFGFDQVEPFYDVFSRHMRDLGTPVLPRRLFERIAEFFRELVVFGAVYRREEPVAAACGFVWRDEFEITWASALRAYSRSAPNMLLYWSFIERMIARRVRVFNFGRCSPGSGTHRFKRQWGGADTPLPWLQWSRHGVTSTPSPDRQLYRLAAAGWRRIPRAVTDRLGPVLARRIP